MKMRALAVLFGLAIVSTFAAAGDEPSGSVLAIGGGKMGDRILDRIVELSRAKEGARLVVCPAASANVDGPEVALFRSRGAVDVVVVDFRSREDADDAKRAAALEGAGGYFFTGGDQKRLLATLRGTRALEAVRAAHRKGALVAGTSAGCAVLGDLSILGGDAASLHSASVPVGEGLGFLPAIVDQHFLARHRHNRLVAALIAHEGHVGVGVDESVALLRRGAGPLEVVGPGTVSLYVPSKQDRRAFTLRLLEEGDRFELR